MSAQKKQDNLMAFSEADVVAMHKAYMDRIEARAAKAVAAAQTPALMDKAVDFLLSMDRLRYDEYKTDALASLLRAASVAKNPNTTLRAAVAKATRAVSRREIEKSHYGDAFVPEEYMNKFNHAAATRYSDPVVEALFDGRDRIYLQMPQKMTPARQEIEGALKRLPAMRKGDRDGYTVTDWSAGLAVDSTGKQTVKIGRLLNKHAPHLLKNFENRDTDNLMIVISRRADDIARASTNRGWDSCAGPRAAGFGYAFDRIGSGIAAGMMIAYLASTSDPEVNNPLSRIMINPFAPNRARDSREAAFGARFSRVSARLVGLGDLPRGDRAYYTGKMYGIQNATFCQEVEGFVNDSLNHGRAGSFWLVPGVYHDGSRRDNIHVNRGRTALITSRA